MLTTKVIKFFQFHHRFVPFMLFMFNLHPYNTLLYCDLDID